MARLLGILVMVLTLYLLLIGSFDSARTLGNHLDLARRLGFYGVLTLGVGVLIIAGGIDLSIGSLVGLSAVAFGVLVQRGFLPAGLAALAVVGAAPVVGLFHGLLVTKLRLQPFLVTLCGLFIYRGIARTLTQTTVGLRITSETILGPAAVGLTPEELRSRLDALRPTAEVLQQRADALASLLVKGQPLGVPNILLVLLGLAALLAVVLHGSVYGRYLFAVGANEQAARYAGIATDRVKIMAYVVCSTFAGLGGVLYLAEYSTATPSNAGSLLELYAITGAVLGGCALRGGEGTVPGMLLGAAVLPLLNKLCNFSRYIGSEQEYTVIGAALLVGTIANELIGRRRK
jgi:ribose transport system permease protein